MYSLGRLIALLSIFLPQFPAPIKGQGNGNVLALRTTPFDEIAPMHGFMPPDYIKERIDLIVKNFFLEPYDQAAAEEVLLTIWNYNAIYVMLAVMDKMSRSQYTYAQYGDECEEDSGGNDVVALDTQMGIEANMIMPTFITGNDFFFHVDAWWEILANTVMYLWEVNEKSASKVCDTRRRGVVCMANSTGGLTCQCPKSEEGIQLVGSPGGICAIERGLPCEYKTGSRRMTDVHQMEIFNDLEYESDVFHTCFGNSFCSGDPEDGNITKCSCWPLMTSEVRAKRNVLLNYTVAGERCTKTEDHTVLKWGKWYVALSIFWFTFPIMLILAPHWDYLFFRLLPGYYRYMHSGIKPDKLEVQTHDIRMDPKVKQFIDENSVLVDVEDPEYFDKVDAVDEQELDPLERFVTAPHCTDKYYHFEWPSYEKLQVWF